MLFSSIPFLYYFLPCILILYFLVPKVLKNPVLLLGSLFFYAWGEPRFVLIMLLEIAAGYVCGLLIEKFRGRAGAKIFLGISVIISLGMLAYFKYTDFFIENFGKITKLPVTLLHIALPIGISFYTFQILSYTIDVYRKDVAAQKNPISLATYVAMFPQLIAGPIVRYSDVENQLKSRPQNFAYASEGTRRFIIGLGKKVLIANELGELCAVFAASDDKSVLFYWLYAVAFMLQIYYDFSGYSDMAIGLGKVFGFDFMENFRYPYISKSITEFWRRWHISLGSWFRDYVYIPLGGNRTSKAKWLRNIFIVWALTGFWHGAEWNFIVWGLLFAVLLIVEKVWLMKYLKKAHVWNHIYVLFFVLISFVIFNAADMREAGVYIAGMFGAGDVPLVSREFLYYLRSYAGVLIVGCIGATPLAAGLIAKLRKQPVADKILQVLEILFLAGCLIVVTAYLVDGSFNPFLYFRF